MPFGEVVSALIEASLQVFGQLGGSGQHRVVAAGHLDGLDPEPLADDPALELRGKEAVVPMTSISLRPLPRVMWVQTTPEAQRHRGC